MPRILKKFNIGVYTYPYRTIGNILPKLKNSVDAIYKRGAIYKILSKDCSSAAFLKPRIAKTMRMSRDPNVSRQDCAEWVAKACNLTHVKEKDLRVQDFKSEYPFLREHYDFKTKIKKSESDSK